MVFWQVSFAMSTLRCARVGRSVFFHFNAMRYPPLLERAGNAGDIAALVGRAALDGHAEIEGGAVRVLVVLEHDVAAALDLRGAGLPHRGRVVDVVRQLDGVLRILVILAGDGQTGEGNVDLH